MPIGCLDSDGVLCHWEGLPDVTVQPERAAEAAAVRAKLTALALAQGWTAVEFDEAPALDTGPDTGPFTVVDGQLVVATTQRKTGLLRRAMDRMAELYADRAGAVRAQQAGEPGPWAAYITERDERIAETRAAINALLG